MSFSKNLKELMIQRNMSQKELCGLTGLSAASVSQYLSVVTGTPKQTTLKKIADALDTSIPFLIGMTNEPDVDVGGFPCKKMTVEEAAKRLGKSEQFVRVSLQRGKAPFGFAVQMASGKFAAPIFRTTSGTIISTSPQPARYAAFPQRTGAPG